MSHYPPLRSTAKSREHQFDADSDELGDNEAHHALPTLPNPPTITLYRPERDSFSTADHDEYADDDNDLDDLTYARQAAGSSRAGGVSLGSATEQPLLKPLHQAAETLDAEMQAFKETPAGTLLSGVFNQTNSIVGAGIVGLSQPSICCF